VWELFEPTFEPRPKPKWAAFYRLDDLGQLELGVSGYTDFWHHLRWLGHDRQRGRNDVR
jgi:hypothetical protein